VIKTLIDLKKALREFPNNIEEKEKYGLVRIGLTVNSFLTKLVLEHLAECLQSGGDSSASCTLHNVELKSLVMSDDEEVLILEFSDDAF